MILILLFILYWEFGELKKDIQYECRSDIIQLWISLEIASFSYAEHFVCVREKERRDAFENQNDVFACDLTSKCQ